MRIMINFCKVSTLFGVMARERHHFPHVLQRYETIL
uniref:Uncharacterized protein n=1 Tax=mine drainage metagenome TaxID=410659 RepID=E6QQ52_9ZZZZ